MPYYLKKALISFATTAFMMLTFGYFVYLIIITVSNETTAYIVLAIIFLWIFSALFYKEIEKDYEEVKKERDVYKKSLTERNSTFPTLLKAIDEYSEARDKAAENYLRYKKHPSPKGAELVKEHSQKRRKAEFELKKSLILVEKYENFAPFLLDYKSELPLPDESEILAEYTEDERLDPAVNYLTKEEFRKLPPVEKNQIALDRYWKRQKSNWQIGKMYERYIGYIYETQGYKVEYSGIQKKLADLGRDIIAENKNEIVVIQCKNWAQFKQIHENHIFQFFGTAFQYKSENKHKEVKAVFYCTNELSDVARKFANEFGIILKENFRMDKNYPCIKCHVSKSTGDKIYHLPIDQQYDNMTLDKNRGDFFCLTTKDAEKNGFRRAFRYKGLKQTK